MAATPLAAPVRSCPRMFASITPTQLPSDRVEEDDDERRVAGDRAVRLRAREPEPAVGGGHERERAAVERQAKPRLVHDLSGREPAERLLDDGHGVRRREE